MHDDLIKIPHLTDLEWEQAPHLRVILLFELHLNHKGQEDKLWL